MEATHDTLRSPKWHEMSTCQQLNQALSNCELELERDLGCAQYLLPQMLLLISQDPLTTLEFGWFSSTEKRAKHLGNICNTEQDPLH